MLNYFTTSWKNLFISKKIYLVVGIMALLILIELLTLRFAMNNLSAVRAFVGGEGLWTKAQKNAVYQIQRYALTNNEKDYLAFHESLKIPEGDHLARVELLKSHPDTDVVRQGFLAGNIHRDDIDRMVLLLQQFKSFYYIQKAMTAWKEADNLLLKLKDNSVEFHNLRLSDAKNWPQEEKILNEINDLNNHLTIVEADFSQALGEGSRWLEKFVFVALLSLVMTVESIGLLLTFLTSRALSKGLFNLNKLAEKIGQGEYGGSLEVNSLDEIGTLTISINKMSLLLQKSYSELQDSHKNLETRITQRTSELAEVARENVKLYEDAKNALKTRDEFLSIASHELRTPITSLLLNLQMLERYIGKDLTEENLHHIKELLKNPIRISKNLSSLNNVLLDLTRIRLGKLEFNFISNDLVQTVQEIIAQLSLDAAREGIELKLYCEAGRELIAQFDPVRIGQVLTNLLTNAIKYSKGSTVDIHMGSVDNMAYIRVTDFGPGVPLEKQNKIFERFERANNDHSVSGLGLGLYISRQLVEAHGGTLELERTSDQGSTFVVKFPLT